MEHQRFQEYICWTYGLWTTQSLDNQDNQVEKSCQPPKIVVLPYFVYFVYLCNLLTSLIWVLKNVRIFCGARFSWFFPFPDFAVNYFQVIMACQNRMSTSTDLKALPAWGFMSIKINNIIFGVLWIMNLKLRSHKTMPEAKRIKSHKYLWKFKACGMAAI